MEPQRLEFLIIGTIGMSENAITKKIRELQPQGWVVYSGLYTVTRKTIVLTRPVAQKEILDECQ